MVKGLTDEQRVALARYRGMWLATQASTQPVDRSAAEAGLSRAYAAAGFSSAPRIEWCAGPRELAERWRDQTKTGSGAANADKTVGRNIRSELFDTMFSRTVSAVERVCGRPLRQAVAEGMHLGRPGPLGSAVVSATLQAIEEPVVRPLLRLRWWANRRRRSAPFHRLTFQDSGYSPHELGWLGSYQFLHEVCGVSAAAEQLSGQWQVAANIGWIVPHERVCWLAERHHILRQDTNDRLHASEGPALAYPDGLAVYSWKGVQVPEALIEHPQRISARMIDREIDPVVRRCMIDIITPARYIATGSPVRISQDDTGILWRKLWWGFDAWAAVEVVNGSPEPDGTFRRYYLQVPPTVRTAREAVAWTYGLSEHQYTRLKMRT